MAHLTDEQYKVISDRIIEEHRKYVDRLAPGEWADVAARKVVSQLVGFWNPPRSFPNPPMPEPSIPATVSEDR